MMIEEIGTFVARDGLALRQRSWTPELHARAVVALLHGGAEHSGRYEHTAERLTAAGFQVDAFDQRSHGASQRVHGVALQIERFEDMVDDTEDWLASRHTAHDRQPLFVLAHSMGALIAVTLATRGRLHVDGLITTGAALELDAVAVPLLVLHGSADTMADPAMSGELVNRAASVDKTLHIIPDGYHALLRDVDRAQVETLVIEWIDARLPVE
jgi:alpha-beta hydrolase superfamily lysophospholipase